MNKIGLSTCGKMPITEQSLRERKLSGIDAIEVCYDEPHYSKFDFEKLKKDADAAEITLWSIHNQWSADYSMSSFDTESNHKWIENMKDLVNRASAVGIDKFVVHPCDTPEPYDDESREERMKHSMYCVDKLADYAYQKNSYIAIENLPRTPLCNTAEEHLKILTANDKLRACVDFNHSMIDPIEKYLELLKDKIITVHVSDRDNINERHWLPGEGVLDWDSIMYKLEEIGYNGVFMYEIPLAGSRTIDRRTLTYRDFYENARALFEHRTPQKIGTPKKNLGMWAPIE